MILNSYTIFLDGRDIFFLIQIKARVLLVMYLFTTRKFEWIPQRACQLQERTPRICFYVAIKEYLSLVSQVANIYFLLCNYAHIPPSFRNISVPLFYSIQRHPEILRKREVVIFLYNICFRNYHMNDECLPLSLKYSCLHECWTQASRYIQAKVSWKITWRNLLIRLQKNEKEPKLDKDLVLFQFVLKISQAKGIHKSFSKNMSVKITILQLMLH